MFAGAAAFLATAASAADMPELYPPVHVPLEASGWYLRGDIGFTNQRVKETQFNFIGVQPDSVDVVSKEFSTGGTFGVGLGYQFNSWLRADITGEYRTASTLRVFEIPDFGGTLSPAHNTMVQSAWVALANLYADLGTWYSFTPFIGVGAGVANVRLAGFTNLNDGAVIVANNSAATGDQWNFAWALYAGLAYRLTPYASIEFAYRYVNLGDAKTGPIIGFDGTAQGDSYELKNIDSHDLKFGVRWMLEPPRPAMMPLIRKG
jgi:opacity protein-like surface antigen